MRTSKITRSVAFPALFCLLLLISACGRATVVLLPAPEGQANAVVVTPKGGDPLTLDKTGMAVDVSTLTTSSYALSETGIQQRFSNTLTALPEPPERFLLYFHSGTTKLRDDSRPLLPKVLQAIKDRQSTDVSVVGHADREGNRKWNFTLSRMRAQAISAQLRQMGVGKELMEITSHGEENPLVPTPDGVSEPRNRRVEVIVR